MPGADTLAEEAPVLVYLYLGMMALMTWLLVRALHYTWVHTLGAVLVWLGNLLNYDKWVVHIHWGDTFLKLDTQIDNFLVKQALAREEDIGHFFHAAARLQLWIVDEIWKGTRDFFLQQAWLIDHLLPLYLRLLHAAIHVVDLGWQRAFRPLEKQVVSLVEHLFKKYAPYLAWLVKNWKTLILLVAAAPGLVGALALPWVHIFPRVKVLEKFRTNANRRLRKLELAVGATAFAAAMANVLGLPNPRCLRSGPVGKIARRLCGLPARALEDILGLLVDLFLLTNICQAITLIEDGFSFIEPEITKFINAVETMACYGDHEHLPPGPPIFLSLPPVTGLVLPLAA